MSRPLDQDDVPVFSVRAVREAIAGAVASERERIRRLAIEHGAAYFTGNLADGIEPHDFADLIGGKT